MPINDTNPPFVKRNFCRIIWQMLFITALCASAPADDGAQQARQQIEQYLYAKTNSQGWECTEQGLDLQAEAVRFYRYRHYRPAWVDRNGLSPEGETAIAITRQAADEGLDFLDYHNRMIAELLNSIAGPQPAHQPGRFDNRIKLELALTGMILRYAFHVRDGRADPSLFNDDAKLVPPPHGDLVMKLSAALEHGDLALATFLSNLGPRHAAYGALKKALMRYDQIRSNGGWPIIDEGPPLKFGDRGARVAMLRYRLAASGDIEQLSEMDDVNVFDDALAIAVMRFQRRHGLTMDGMVGPATMAAMNVPVDRRIRQIRLNMERWRWMPREFEPRHILVNIPEFKLKVVERRHIIKTMRAIVGREERPTPVISSRMTYLELNPYWQVPTKIAREDLLPKIQRNPQFLAQQNFQIFDSWEENARPLDPHAIDWSALSEDYFPFRLRQAPTPHNALGRIKFMFPNKHSVYIHDTPSKRLFDRSSRSFSSGCVRVEDPEALAALLLRRQNWSRMQLTEALATGQRQVVVLKEPVPVYLVYMTAWAEEDNEIYFTEDIYGRDRQLQMLIADALRAERRCAETHPAFLVRSDVPARAANSIELPPTVLKKDRNTH